MVEIVPIPPPTRPRPRLAALDGQEVVAWSDRAGVYLIPAADIVIPGPELSPLAADNDLDIPEPPVGGAWRGLGPRSALLASELQLPRWPTWWTRWLGHMRGHPRDHVEVVMLAAFLCGGYAVAIALLGAGA